MEFAENVQHKIDWQTELGKPRTGYKNIIVWDYRHLDILDLAINSDIHWGHRELIQEKVEAKVERIHRKQIPFMDLGDLVENATRDSVGAGVYEQQDIVDGQIDDVIRLYSPVKHLLKVMQTGNHELRTWNKSGINLTKIIARELGVPVGGAGVIHYILVGGERYIGYTHHGGSGAVTPGGKLQSMLKMGLIVPNADFYWQGHGHETMYHAAQGYEFDKKSRTIVEKTRHFGMNGSWLRYWNSYGQVKAYSPTNVGNAELRFRGDKHEIRVSFV